MHGLQVLVCAKNNKKKPIKNNDSNGNYEHIQINFHNLKFK